MLRACNRLLSACFTQEENKSTGTEHGLGPFLASLRNRRSSHILVEGIFLQGHNWLELTEAVYLDGPRAL